MDDELFSKGYVENQGSTVQDVFRDLETKSHRAQYKRRLVWKAQGKQIYSLGFEIFVDHFSNISSLDLSRVKILYFWRRNALRQVRLSTKEWPDSSRVLERQKPLCLQMALQIMRQVLCCQQSKTLQNCNRDSSRAAMRTCLMHHGRGSVKPTISKHRIAPREEYGSTLVLVN